MSKSLIDSALFSIPPLISAVAFLVLGLVCLWRRRFSLSVVSFFLLCVSTFHWQFLILLLMNASNAGTAYFLAKVAYTGIIFIPVFYYQFAVEILEHRRERIFVWLSYALAVVFECLLWFTDSFITHAHLHSWGWYPLAGVFHPIYLVALAVQAFRSVYLLAEHQRRPHLQPTLKVQLKFLLAAYIIYFFAATDFFQNYGGTLYPFGFDYILISLLIISYTIFKHHLMEVVLLPKHIAAIVAVPVVSVLIYLGWRLDIVVHVSRVSPLVGCITSLLLGGLVYLHNPKKLQNVVFFMFSVVLSVWGLGCFGQSVTRNYELALLYDQIIYSVAPFAPTMLFQLVSTFTQKKRPLFLSLGYLMGGVFLVANWTLYFRTGVDLRFGTRFVTVPDIGWFYYVGFYAVVIGLAMYDLFSVMLREKGFRRTQLYYVFVSFVVLVTGGICYFALILYEFPLMAEATFNLASSLLLVAYGFITVYAIFRYQLMEIVFLARNIAAIIAVPALAVLVYFGRSYPGVVINTLLLLGFLADISLGFFILTRKKRDESTIAFSVGAICIGLWTLGVLMYRESSDFVYALYWNRELLFSAGIIASSLLHFSFVYPRKNGIPTFTKLLIHLPNLFVLAGLFVPGAIIKEIVVTDWGHETLMGTGYQVFGAYFSVYMGATYINLLRSFLKTTGRLKEQIKYIFLAISVSVVFGSFFNLYLTMMGNLRYIWIGPLASFVFVVVTAYAIVKHGLMDIDYVVWRNIKTIRFAPLLLFLAFLAYPLFSLSFTQFLIVLTVTYLLFLLIYSSSLEQGIFSLADELFYKGRYRVGEELLHFSLQIPRLARSVDLLAQRVAEPLQRAFRTQVMVHLFCEGVYPQTLPKASPVLTIAEEGLLRDYFLQHREPLVIEELENGRAAQGGEQRAKLLLAVDRSYRLLVPILPPASQQIMGKSCWGYVALGAKSTGAVYTTDELEALQHLGEQMAVALGIIRMHRVLQEEEAAESERILSQGTALALHFEEVVGTIDRAQSQLLLLEQLLDRLRGVIPDDAPLPIGTTPPPHPARLYMVRQEVGKLTREAQGLKRFFPLGERSFSKISIAPLLKEAAERLLAYRLGKINFTMKADTHLPPVMGDRRMLFEVFHYLFAIFSAPVPRGGALTVSAEWVQHDKEPGWVQITLYDPTGKVNLSLVEEGHAQQDASDALWMAGLVRRVVEQKHKGKLEFVASAGGMRGLRIWLK